MRSGVIVEEQPATSVGATADGSTGALDQEFGGRTGEGGEKPVQTAFPCHKLKRPGTFLGYKLVVTLGYAENFIDRLYPRAWKGLIVDDGGENGPQRLAKSQDTEQGCVDGVGLRQKQGPKTGGAILGDKVSVYQE